MTGDKLAKMYRTLADKDKGKEKRDGAEKKQPKKRDDLEDGEIDDDEEARRRARRELRRESSEDVRRDYRRDDYRHRAYENGDRLSFRRDRDRPLSDRSLADRGRPSWSPDNQHRQSPY